MESSRGGSNIGNVKIDIISVLVWESDLAHFFSAVKKNVKLFFLPHQTLNFAVLCTTALQQRGRRRSTKQQEKEIS